MSDKPEAMTEAHTPTPWHWTIEDHSMAILSGPDSMTQHVVSVSPCEVCQNRADPKEWVWGRCTTIKKADAEYLVLAVNSHARLLKEREELRRALADLSETFADFLGDVGNQFGSFQWDAVERARAQLKSKD